MFGLGAEVVGAASLRHEEPLRPRLPSRSWRSFLSDPKGGRAEANARLTKVRPAKVSTTIVRGLGTYEYCLGV